MLQLHKSAQDRLKHETLKCLSFEFQLSISKMTRQERRGLVPKTDRAALRVERPEQSQRKWGHPISNHVCLNIQVFVLALVNQCQFPMQTEKNQITQFSYFNKK